MAGGDDVRLDTPVRRAFKVCTTDSLCPRRYLPTEATGPTSPTSLLECHAGEQTVTTDAFASRC